MSHYSSFSVRLKCLGSTPADTFFTSAHIPAHTQVPILRKTFALAMASLEEERNRQIASDEAAGVHVATPVSQLGTDAGIAAAGASILQVSHGRCEAAQLEVLSAALDFETSTGWVMDMHVFS